MKTIDIPGGTATLREKQDIRIRHRRLIEAYGIAAAPVLAKMPQDKDARAALTEADVLKLGISGKEAKLLFDLQDATIVAALIGWTLPGDLPDMDTVGDLEPDVYEAISDGCAGLGAEIAQETFEISDPLAPGFKETPTQPSAASDSGSQGTQRSGSTDTPHSSGTSTDTALSSMD